MHLQFLGACREVGRSALLACDDDLCVQLDSGTKVRCAGELPDVQPVKNPHAVICTHAHLDHSGNLPTHYKHNAIPAFMTAPTLPLANLLLEDAQKLALKKNKQPAFGHKDLLRLNQKTVPLGYNQEYHFYTGASFQFYDAGHILGSAGVLFRGKKDETVFYTGDFKPKPTRLHSGAEFPEENITALVTESTYAGKEQPNRDDLEKKFIADVQDVLDKDEPAIIPAFAVGRSQEIISILRARGITADIFVDGMAAKVNDIFAEYPQYVRDPKKLMQWMESAKPVMEHADRRHAVKGANVIVTTAGMLDGGPILDYLQLAQKVHKGKIFLTGFQVDNSNGSRLVHTGNVRIDGETVKIDLPFDSYPFSAHGKGQDLIDTAKALNPEKVFCVHGDANSCVSLATALQNEGFEAYAPFPGEVHEL